MKQSGLLIAIMIFLSGCGASPFSTPTPDTQATMQVLASTMVAATLTAQPTLTPVPTNTSAPTETFTPAPTETSTPEPTSAISPTPTIDPSQPTATPWSGVLSPGNTEGLPMGFVRIENNTGEKEIIVTLTGVTLTRSQPIYLSYKVTGFLLLSVPWAHYQYVIQIPNKRMLTGEFTQANEDKTTIRVLLTRVIVAGP